MPNSGRQTLGGSPVQPEICPEEALQCGQDRIQRGGSTSLFREAVALWDWSGRRKVFLVNIIFGEGRLSDWSGPGGGSSSDGLMLARASH